jgi:membrane-bound ClpP family serine protease
VGHKGEATTELRPVGTCVIDGRREECLATTGVIERGTPIEVVSQDGMYIKVRPIEA